MTQAPELTNAELFHWSHAGTPLNRMMARELLARRCASAAPADAQPVTLTYTNWRGETAERSIIPIRAWFGSTDWHPEPQWLLTALDVEKGAERDFALKDFGKAATADDALRMIEAKLAEETKR